MRKTWAEKEIENINKSCKTKKHRTKFINQFNKQGWTDSATWNIDITLAKYMYPILKRFRELNNGYPNGDTEHSWNVKIDKMIAAFDIMANDNEYYELHEKSKGNKLKKYMKLKEGLELFHTHLMHLWW